METVHTETIEDVTYTLAIEPDHLDVRGNALASGDDVEDKRVEDDIIERLNDGDTWAWACVRVTASIQIEGETFEGTDYLGGCSYRDTADFIKPGGYYDDMKDEAKAGLGVAVQAAIKRGEVAKGALKQFGLLA